jgi:hypothetical protein
MRLIVLSSSSELSLALRLSREYVDRDVSLLVECSESRAEPATTPSEVLHQSIAAAIKARDFFLGSGEWCLCKGKKGLCCMWWRIPYLSGSSGLLYQNAISLSRRYRYASNASIFDGHENRAKEEKVIL